MTDSHSRRSLLTATGLTLGSLGLAGCSSLTDTDEDPTPDRIPSPTPTNSPTSTGEQADDEGSGDGAADAPADGGPVAALEIANPDAEYAVLGSADAPKTATLYGGWKCPYTQEFVLQMFPDVIEQYVAPGDLAVEFRAVRYQADEPYGDDEPRANRAGQAVWHETPQQFPAYLQTLFANQPDDTAEWATVERLLGFAEQAGIQQTDPIRDSVTGGEYTANWKQTMDVVREKGIRGIPRFELGGEITAPVIDPEAFRKQLTSAIDSGE